MSRLSPVRQSSGEGTMRKIITALGAASATVGIVLAGAGLANASTASAKLAGGEKGYTQTSPEYVISDENASVSYTPGAASWASTDNEPNGWWVDTYNVTGYSRGNDTDELGGSQVDKNAYRIPAPLVGTGISSGMTYSGSVTRPGWDLWLVPTSETSSWTSATVLEAHSQSVEIMLQPGGGGYISNPVGDGHQHRAYVGGGNLRSENLTSIAERWLRAMHLNPSSYSWESIDGGYESDDHGRTFTLKSYSLDVHLSASATEGYGYNAYKTASGQGITVGAWHYVYARKSATASVTLLGRNYSTARADAVADAESAALTDAKDTAIIDADAAARAAAERELTAREPWGWTPRVVGDTVQNADAILRADGFNHRVDYGIKLKRGYHAVVSGQTDRWMAKTGTVYIWERAVR